MTFETTEPRLMKGSIARIDLSLKKFSFTVTPRAPEDEWGKPMKAYIERNLAWLSILFFILLIGAFFLIKLF